MQRGAVVAACITAAGIAALPLAGGGAPGVDLVATGPAALAAPSTTVPPAPPTTTAPVAEAPPPDAVAVEAPPIDFSDPGAGVGPATGVAAPAPPALPPEPAPTPADEVSGSTPVAGPPTVTEAPEAPAAEPPRPTGLLRTVVDGLRGDDRPPSSAPPPQESPPTEPPTTLPPAVVAHPERLWVVSIGIDDYPGDRHDLRAARNDAITVSDAMVGLGLSADHLYELLDGAATADAVVLAAQWLVEHAGPGDTAIFFYGGHIRDVGYGTQVLVTADGAWVSDWYLAQVFSGLQARSTWFAIAGCYGGGFDELLAPGRILTAAADPDELAYESSALGRSYMVEYLFERAIIQRRAAAPTVQAAVQWANDHLASDYGDFDLWHVDDAGRTVSLDGADRS